MGSQSGVAVEVNWNYNDPFKVQRDLCKLIDPKNAYTEALYFAYGRSADLLKTVQEGVERAFKNFTEADSRFLLPAGLRIIVAVRQRHREAVTHFTYIAEPCTPSQLSWSDSRDENDPAQNGRKQEPISAQEDKMTDYVGVDDRSANEGRHSYQTVPLSTYSEENQRVAAEFFHMIIRLGARTRRHKGSYSVFGRSSQETVAKIVIYEDGKGKLNGALSLRPGVYALIRANGTAGEQNRATLAAKGLLAALPTSDTIGVAPAHAERFHYLRADDTNVNQCLEMFRVCACNL
jgi:hypothetical protein